MELYIEMIMNGSSSDVEDATGSNDDESEELHCLEKEKQKRNQRGGIGLEQDGKLLPVFIPLGT